MGKYGKKNHVSVDPFSYNHILLGESKIGKTTIVYKMLEKYLGEDGYMFLELGKEEGHAAIEGIIAEECKDWEKFEEVIDDIIENKTTDYPDLKMIVIDTLDQLIEIAEPEVIRMYNRILASNNKPERVTSINSAYGGFGKGLDKTIEIIFDKLWALKEVGVNFFIIGHVKMKDITDPSTQQTFQKLTSDMTQRYFNAIKNKAHFVGLAYIDRNIQNVDTGKKDIKGKKVMKSVATGDDRKISFRDNNLAMDSGSRFAEIQSTIDMNEDALYEAYVNAIKAEQAKSGKSFEQAKKEQEKENAEHLSAIEKREKQLKEQNDLGNVLSEMKQLAKDNHKNENFAKAFKKSMKENNFNSFDEINDLKIAKSILENLKKSL